MWLLLMMAAATPTELLDRVQKNVANATDFSAEFRHSNVTFRKTKPLQESGKVFLKKPGLMRSDYDKPNAKSFIFDGERVWIYKPDDMQVTVLDKIDKSKLSGGLLFLLSAAPLKDSYTPEHFTGPDPQGLEVSPDAVRLIPKKKDPEVKEVVLYLDKAGMLTKAFTQDYMGNFNVFELRNVKLNQGLKKEAFLFAPPDGVKVLHAD